MTTKPVIFIMAIVASLILTTNSFAASEHEQFEDTWIILEQNYTDQDSEVVIFAKGTDEGMKKLKISGPNRKNIIELKAKKQTLGAREFVMESPEPNLDDILEAYPEGEYTFEGQNVSGVKLRGTAFLSHAIPEPANITNPGDGAGDIDPNEDLVIEWVPVGGAVKYLVEVEREDPEPELTLQGDTLTNTFTVSADWLEEDAGYQVGVAVVNEDGNITWVEQEFSTTGSNP